MSTSEVRLYEGTVTKFYDARGYGFAISPDHRGTDIFIHHSSIVAPPGQYRTLRPGQRVRFGVIEGDGGRLQAVRVEVLPQAEGAGG